MATGYNNDPALKKFPMHGRAQRLHLLEKQKQKQKQIPSDNKQHRALHSPSKKWSVELLQKHTHLPYLDKFLEKSGHPFSVSRRWTMFLEVLNINLWEKPKAQKTHTGVLSVKQQNSV